MKPEISLPFGKDSDRLMCVAVPTNSTNLTATDFPPSIRKNLYHKGVEVFFWGVLFSCLFAWFLFFVFGPPGWGGGLER